MSRLAITIRAATPHDAQRIQRVTNAAIRAIVSADYTPQEIAGKAMLPSCRSTANWREER